MGDAKDNLKKHTNGWDFLISLFNSLFNLKLSKIGALFLLWFLIRDVIFVIKLPKGYNFGDNLVDELEFLKYIFQNDSLAIVILAAVIAVLIVIIIALILYNKVIRKEIDRMAEIRSELIHGFREGKLTNLKEHVSTV